MTKLTTIIACSRRLAQVVAALLVASPLQTSAQQVIPPGQLRLGGMPVVCGPIPTVIQPLPDIAMARPGLILLNPSIQMLPPVLQVFIYAHECGHHMVGSDEAAADCWAIRVGRQQGWFRPNNFNELISMFGNSPGDWTHAPGPQRIQHMVRCFQS